MEEPILQAAELRKDYRSGHEDLVVLREVSFAARAGSTMVITGESGCGKSTLLNLLGGLDRPTAGRILFQGRSIEGLPEESLSRYRCRQVGFIFQLHYLLRDFTALENVLMPSLILGDPPAEARVRARKLLERVGMSDRLNHFPLELSGGERQRAAVVRALMNDPPLILADEPTGNLDELNAGRIRELLFQLVREMGKTLVLVTHDRSTAALADHSFRLEHGVLSPC